MSNQARPRRVVMACVGGFLGSGKTTAIVAAARALMKRGLRVGVITNDQGSALVDTGIMRGLDLATEEITGGCFCCKFDALVDHAHRLLVRARPDVILAEAVGSCTDLAATVYQPLRRFYATEFDLAPLSIFVEPSRLRAFSAGAMGFPSAVAYLFRQQLAEADVVVLSKEDTMSDADRGEMERLLGDLRGNAPWQAMSAAMGVGVEAWVDVLLGTSDAGRHVLDIDYDTYAEAEAAMGWLNATVEVVAEHDFSPQDVAERLVTAVQRRCAATSAAIAHVKVLVVTKDGCGRAGVTADRDSVTWSGDTGLAGTREASLIVNARVHADPERLTRVIEESVAGTARACEISATVQHLESFRPSPPRPSYRFAAAAR